MRYLRIPLLMALAFLLGLLYAAQATQPAIDQILAAQGPSLKAQNEVAHDILLMKRYNVPGRYFYYVKSDCRRYEINLEFALQMILLESGFDEFARSPAGAHGLMQVKFQTALIIEPTLQSYWQLYDPQTNIRIGIAYFRLLLDRYGGDYRSAAIAYNRGLTRYDEESLDGEAPGWYYDKVMGLGQSY